LAIRVITNVNGPPVGAKNPACGQIRNNLLKIFHFSIVMGVSRPSATFRSSNVGRRSGGLIFLFCRVQDL
jgi:hypothetical protein